ncbi:MAG: FkbM family methyltransferase [Thermincolia bacterium]
MYRQTIKNQLVDVIEKSKAIPKRTIAEIMTGFREKPVLIYGAGSFGKQIYSIFNDYSVKVEAFLDINAIEGERLFNVPVFRPDDDRLDSDYKQQVIVILSIVLNKNSKNELINRIRSCGYQNVIYAQEIRCRFTGAEKCDLESPDYNYYQSKMDAILKGVDLWADEASAQIYKGNVISHILRDYQYCLESADETQYFLKDIEFNKGYSRFIDCGAYIGDTLQDLVREKGRVKAVAVFEPEIGNFKRLNEYIDQNFGEIADNIVLYPCGVGKKTEMVQFKPLGGSSSISGDGNILIQCIAIDDVLKKFNPTFIKMDVEGAEYGALLGAKNTITKSRPDMAICLYHYINHLWDIPLLLKSWDLGYKFHLKAHSACGMETVLYAVAK